MAWDIFIGQPFVKQERIGNIHVSHSKNSSLFNLEILHSTQTERDFIPGRLDAMSIMIKRGTEIIFIGYIEDVDPNETTKYSGRDARILLERTTEQNKEYENQTGAYIIEDLVTTYCPGITVSGGDIDYTDILGGKVRCGNEKVSKIVTELCDLHDKEWWIEVTVSGDTITARNLHVGKKERGSSSSPYTTLRGGVNIIGLPVRKNRTRKSINYLKVLGKGTKTGRVSATAKDLASQAIYGIIEGTPYENNLISDEKTAKEVGDAIIAAKKNLSIDVNIELAYYITDLQYGDWVNIIDTYTGTDINKQILKCTYERILGEADDKQVEFGTTESSFNSLLQRLNRKLTEDSSVMTDIDGILNVHPETPPSRKVIIDSGTYYGISGTKIIYDGQIYEFTEPIFSLANRWMKILLQISGDKSLVESGNGISYVKGTEYDNKTSAEAEEIDASTGNIPISEIILHSKSVATDVADIYEFTSEYDGEYVSYIYKETRPFIGTPLSEQTSGSGTGYRDKIIGKECLYLSEVTRFLQYHDTVYTSYTSEINESTVNDVPLFDSAPIVNDAVYVGGRIPFDKFRINIGQAGVGTWTLQWQYWNGSSWAGITDVTDPTNGFTTAGTLDITFTPPTDWAEVSVSGAVYFWIRGIITTYGSMTTQPLASEGWLILQPFVDCGTLDNGSEILFMVPNNGRMIFRKVQE